MIVSVGSWSAFIVLNIVLMIVTAQFGASLECGNIPGWACGSPFEGLVSVATQDLNLLSVFSFLGGAVNAVFKMLILDYEVLKGGGEIVSAFGFLIRALGWFLVSVGVVSAGLRILS